MKISKEHTIKTDICIIGGGIIGSIVASEVAEKGFNVTVLEVLNNKAPFNLNSKNITIDQQANNFGIGGNEKIWSQLASFIDQEEWKFYSNKYNIELEYDELLELEKKAQLYGFCDLKTLKSSPEREPNSLTKFKKLTSNFLISLTAISSSKPLTPEKIEITCSATEKGLY